MFTTLGYVHLISIVCYFFGIFMLGQIFLYYKRTDQYSEVRKKIHRKRYVFISERLWNMIIIPSGFVMLATGLIMICLRPELLLMQSFELKLVLLVVLCLYHFWCKEKIRHLKSLCGTNLEVSPVCLSRANEMLTWLLFLLSCTTIVKCSALIHSWQVMAGICILFLFLVATLRFINR
ncbi:CopD family protein [Chryseobacterium rhizoplanae]|uniref:CopD family protein n=1 Tax=Chryseobacterium rhizoplanae TaxID=1609531 RepID=UPI001CE2D7C1|nr:CopD family protein [Chryseobacterium rhizoplanae]